MASSKEAVADSGDDRRAGARSVALPAVGAGPATLAGAHDHAAGQSPGMAIRSTNSVRALTNSALSHQRSTSS